MSCEHLVSARDVQQGAHRISSRIHRTALIPLPIGPAIRGCHIVVKAENLQRTGSFKIRGALNKLLRLGVAERAGGVVAWSSGNHGAAVAVAASMLGLDAILVMPHDTPAAKRDQVRAAGAEIIGYDRHEEDREAIARAVAIERGAVLIPPFDDPDIVAGQGTIGLEVMEDLAKLGRRPGHVLVCCSGGGLVAGIAAALSELEPRPRVTAVEPMGFDGFGASLAAGEVVARSTAEKSICDALLSPFPGKTPLHTALSYGVDACAVSDASVRKAMRFAAETCKLILEPGGAAALAAVLDGHHDETLETVVVIASGGNVDMNDFCTWIGSR